MRAASPSEAGAPLDPETIEWFPERGWGGRVFVPVTGRATEPSERRAEDEEQARPGASTSATSPSCAPRTASPATSRPGRLHRRHRRGQPRLEDRPQRRRDRRLAGRGRTGAATSPWSGACRWCAARSRPPPSSTARSSTRPPSRTAASRWSPSTPSRGFGDDLYLEVTLWDRTLRQIARREPLRRGRLIGTLPG